MTDYEVRDLNDEINKLLREKRNWENQIVALGGANYKRNVAMLDEDGKEVPGTKGYKYAVIFVHSMNRLTSFFLQVLRTGQRLARSQGAISEPQGRS